jgi:hypothetical protein
MRPAQLTAALVTALALAVGPASAECYAEYKAKRENPYSLDRGVMEIPDGACDRSSAEAIVAERLAAEGWTLLSIVSVSGGQGSGDGKGNAGN